MRNVHMVFFLSANMPIMIEAVCFRDFLSDPARKAEFMALTNANCEEAEGDLFGGVLRVNYEAYFVLQDQGNLFVLIAIDRGRIVGYCVAIFSVDLHYGVRFATNDTLFVLPEARKKGYGIGLMKAAESITKKMGGRFFRWTAKKGSRFDRFLLLKGYEAVETEYIKEL